jgi:nucleotide-binding universal stress UspA family protein
MAIKFDRPVVLAHVVHERAENAGMYRRHQETFDTTPLYEIARAMLEERVASYRRTCKDLDRVCEIGLAVVPGVPQTRLVQLAAHYDASMIVMCSHNRRGLSHWLYGSVTEHVVRNATCPVVVVGQGDGAFAPLTVHRPLEQSAAQNR